MSSMSSIAITRLGRLNSRARRNSHTSSVDGEPTVQVGLSALLQLFLWQHLVPMGRAIDFRLLVGDEEHAFWRDAALVVGHAQRLAIGSLRLLDSHADGHADVDVQLLASRVLQVQQGSLPDGVAAVQLTCLLYRLVHIFLIVHIDGGLEEEAFGHGVLLRASVVPELVVVSAAERQLLLQFIVTPTDGSYQVCHPGISDGLVIDREWLGAYAPFIAILVRIICYNMFHFFNIE